MKYYNQDIIPKVHAYLKTMIVKSMDTSRRSYEENTPIAFDNLLSLVLYTDYSDLSAYFSSTFRKKWTFEPLEGVKARNRKYWFWTKALTETVQVYGQFGDDLPGPFYTGMSKVLNMPQFNIFLQSPTSTSAELAVAMRFSGQTGMIIQFQNKTGDAQFCSGFDCSFLSRYKEEEERYIQVIIHQL